MGACLGRETDNVQTTKNSLLQRLEDDKKKKSTAEISLSSPTFSGKIVKISYCSFAVKVNEAGEAVIV